MSAIFYSPLHTVDTRAIYLCATSTHPSSRPPPSHTVRVYIMTHRWWWYICNPSVGEITHVPIPVLLYYAINSAYICIQNYTIMFFGVTSASEEKLLRRACHRDVIFFSFFKVHFYIIFYSFTLRPHALPLNRSKDYDVESHKRKVHIKL